MKATSDWLSTWARFRPDHEAIFDVGTGRRFTYAALKAESDAWARRLQREGVGPGDRVAVMALNRAETLAILFACAELGAILFPVNWRLSPAEVRYQLDDCPSPALDVHVYLGLDRSAQGRHAHTRPGALERAQHDPGV